MPETPTYALPYPNAVDPPNVPVDVQELAERLDAVLASLDRLGIIDAKGDLIAGTGPDAVGRLAAGTNGQLLAADSALPVGLRWVDPPAPGAAIPPRLGPLVATPPNNDLNQIAESGWYSGVNLANAPNGSPVWFYVACIVHDAPHQSQEAWELTTAPPNWRFRRQKVAGTWSAWRVVDQPFQLLGLQDGWTSYPYGRAPCYGIRGGIVFVQGLVKRDAGLPAQGASMVTLPPGYRPADTLVFRPGCNQGSVRLDVTPGGAITYQNEATGTIPNVWTSFTGITYPADQ